VSTQRNLWWGLVQYGPKPARAEGVNVGTYAVAPGETTIFHLSPVDYTYDRARHVFGDMPHTDNFAALLREVRLMFLLRPARLSSIDPRRRQMGQVWLTEPRRDRTRLPAAVFCDRRAVELVGFGHLPRPLRAADRGAA
jgi:hypothetical protein